MKQKIIWGAAAWLAFFLTTAAADLFGSGSQGIG